MNKKYPDMPLGNIVFLKLKNNHRLFFTNRDHHIKNGKMIFLFHPILPRLRYRPRLSPAGISEWSDSLRKGIIFNACLSKNPIITGLVYFHRPFSNPGFSSSTGYFLLNFSNIASPLSGYFAYRLVIGIFATKPLKIINRKKCAKIM